MHQSAKPLGVMTLERTIIDGSNTLAGKYDNMQEKNSLIQRLQKLSKAKCQSGFFQVVLRSISFSGIL